MQAWIQATRPWLQATRPKTLTAALVPVVAGSALAHALGRLERPSLSAFALLSAMCIQIGTNLVNDAIDFKKGADTETRIGPTRVTQSGMLSPKQVMAGAFFFFAVALALGVPLVMHGGRPLIAIGLVSLFFAYGYTGGPFPLAYLGLGDLFVLIFFGWVAVGGVVFLQTGSFLRSAFVLGTQIGFLSTVLIAVNNLRDHEQDRLVGKNTLAVRLGVQGSRLEIAALVALPFLLNAYWWTREMRAAALLPLLALPLGVKLVRSVFVTPPSPAYNRFLGQAAGLHLLFGILWAVGCFL